MKITKKIYIVVFLMVLFLVSCQTKKDVVEDSTITMCTYTRQYGDFEQTLHEVYPDVDIEFVSYKGSNATDYAITQLKANDIPDIFCISAPPVDELQTQNLYDMSKESFLQNFSNSIIKDLSIDGGVYLVPTTISLLGIYYNKTLFDKHNWKVPNSLNELEELVPKILEAGVRVAENYNQYYGTSFAHFFDVNAEYFTSLNGIKWMKDFLSGKQTAKGNLEECVTNFQKWIDLGMFSADEESYSISSARDKFKEGNTAFLLPNTNLDFYQNADNTGDEYGLIPFLSQDGTKNRIVTLGSAYYGISKKLADNPKKLENALKVLSFIATKEGQDVLSNSVSNTIYSLKTEGVSIDSPLYEVTKLVDKGETFPYVQTGWENYMSVFGEDVLEMVKGNIDGTELLQKLDDLYTEIKENDGLPKLADVSEDLEKDDVAQLVGTAFAKATDADCALISMGEFHGHGIENSKGINAKIYSKVKLDKNVICTFNPLGWTSKINTVTLTGAQINEWLEEGFYYKTQTKSYPYKLIKKEGMTLEDDKTYKVAIVIEFNERIEIGNMTSTDLVGQTVLEEYVKSLKTLSKETIRWI